MSKMMPEYVVTRRAFLRTASQVAVGLCLFHVAEPSASTEELLPDHECRPLCVEDSFALMAREAAEVAESLLPLLEVLRSLQSIELSQWSDEDMARLLRASKKMQSTSVTYQDLRNRYEWLMGKDYERDDA